MKVEYIFKQKNQLVEYCHHSSPQNLKSKNTTFIWKMHNDCFFYCKGVHIHQEYMEKYTIISSQKYMVTLKT